MANNFFTDNDDLQFYVRHGLDWATLVELTEHGFRAPDGPGSVDEAVELYTSILELTGEFVATRVAPHAAELDREGVSLVDGEVVHGPRQAQIIEEINALEMHGLCVPRELGGLGCPLMVYMLSAELFARADASVMTHHGFHNGMAMAMLVYSINEGTTCFDSERAVITETRFAGPIGEIVRGEAWGCMDITEPDAGSDMGALRARAWQDDDGQWRVSGQKIFITSGHGKYHFVIARTEAAGDLDDPMAGLAGLSMFLVPAYEDGPDGQRRRVVAIDRVEEKLGHHASATCALSFDAAPAHLIGARGEGFRYMLTLMNNARVGVGFEALGLCEAALRMARAYAAERPSMGKPIDRHEMIADYLDEMDSDLRGLRALAVNSGFAEEVAQKLRLELRFNPDLDEVSRQRLERAQRRHARRSRRLTPLLKYLAAEKAVEMARRCVQIHGGVGYTADYGAEKLLRDALVLPIYEGTSQIQALMAMKDTLGAIIKNPQGFIRRVAQARWRALSARDPLERRLARLQSLSLSAQQHLITRTAATKLRTLPGKPLGDWPRSFLRDWNPKRDFAHAMLHAERLTGILADEAIGELLLEQARRHPSRRVWLERHLERAEPRCRHLHELVTTTGQRLIDHLRGDSAPPQPLDAEAAS